MNRRGFTLIEVMVTGAVIGVLATLAIPSYHQRIVRAQVTESLQLTEAIKTDVEAYYRQNRRFPANNATIGLPPPDKLIGNYVNKMVEGNTISLRPLVVEDSPRSPMSWSCGTRAAPTGMVSAGENRTDVPLSLIHISEPTRPY